VPDGRRVLIACCVMCLCKESASTAGGCAAARSRRSPDVGPTSPVTDDDADDVRRIMGTIYCLYVGVNEQRFWLLVWCGNIVSSGVHGRSTHATRGPGEQCAGAGRVTSPPGPAYLILRSTQHADTALKSETRSCDAARPHTWIPATVTHEFLIDSNARYVDCSSSGRPRPHMPHASVM